MYNDEWMRSRGFFEVMGMAARELVGMGGAGELFSVEASRRVDEAAKLMGTHDFSQLSITKNGRLIGSLNETHLYEELVKDPDVRAKPVEAIMQPAFPFVDISTPVELLASMISPENPAVLVRDFKTEKTFIITRSDIMRVLM
jgi:cystathionine beta-synthase